MSENFSRFENQPSGFKNGKQQFNSEEKRSNIDALLEQRDIYINTAIDQVFKKYTKDDLLKFSENIRTLSSDVEDILDEKHGYPDLLSGVGWGDTFQDKQATTKALELSDTYPRERIEALVKLKLEGLE